MDAIILYLLLSSSDPTYTKDIKPIFQTKCQDCHNAGTPGRNWLNYKEAFGKKNMILNRVTIKKDMPPLDWPKKVTPEEIELIKKWVGSGAKE